MMPSIVQSMRMRDRTVRSTRRVVLTSTLLLGVLSAAACSTDKPYPTASQSNQLLGRLVLNYRAVTLANAAPYNTVQLRATIYSAAGQPLDVSDPPTITFSNPVVSDTSLNIDSTSGLVTARLVAAGAKVVAKATYHGVTVADTAIVKVTLPTAVHVPASISIHPVPPDSASMDAQLNYVIAQLPNSKSIKAIVLDSTGTTVALTSYVIDYESSASTVAKFATRTSPTLSAIQPGGTWLSARMYAYGVALTDSLEFAVTNPHLVVVEIDTLRTLHDGWQRSFSPSVSVIATRGMVAWMNIAVNDSVDIVFDDTTNIRPADLTNFVALSFPDPTGLGGNIPAWAQDSVEHASLVTNLMRIRTFPVAGTYHYHSTRYPISGTVIVTDSVVSRFNP